MLSAMIERALLPVQRNRTLNCRSLIVASSVSSSGFAAGRRAARSGRLRRALARLLGAYERAHEFAVDERRDRILVDALAGKELARVVDLVNAGRFDTDRLESGRDELDLVVVFIERAGDAADPEQHVATNAFRNRSAGDDIRDREA